MRGFKLPIHRLYPPPTRTSGFHCLVEISWCTVVVLDLGAGGGGDHIPILLLPWIVRKSWGYPGTLGWGGASSFLLIFAKFRSWVGVGRYHNIVLCLKDCRNERFISVSFQNIQNFKNRFSRKKLRFCVKSKKSENPENLEISYLLLVMILH